MDDTERNARVNRILGREIALCARVEVLERAQLAIRAAIERAQSATLCQSIVAPELHDVVPMYPGEFDMSHLVNPESFFLTPTLTMHSYGTPERTAPPEFYEPLPSTITDRVFPSFVGFEEQDEYRACILCGTTIHPSVVSNMGLPGGESLGTLQVCACVLANEWPEIVRPFDETGRPTVLGLMGA